jgi:AraC family transcriptional regulator of adaptative response/methylated-DNA-[protein]-cysteine methyltransferase
MIATQVRDRAVDPKVRFRLVECDLGWIMVAATERGICMIAFGDAPEQVREELDSCFAGATSCDHDPEFGDWVNQIVAHVEAPSHPLDLPLDVRGTAFQRRVWEELRAVPVGTTATYAEIARRIGKPKAVRAVASACAANKLAVVIPCHRIVRKDGLLSGYRWGVERKRKLIEREGHTYF